MQGLAVSHRVLVSNAPFAIIARANGSGTVTSGGAGVTIGRTFELVFSLMV